MRKTVICVMAVMLVACGGGGTGTTAQPNTQSRPIRGSADIITEAEINAGVYQNALEVVQSLRPTMMRPRQGGANAQVMFYLDGVRMSELNGMSTIPAERVREIRFINARDATTRWGTGHDSGVILVTTKR